MLGFNEKGLSLVGSGIQQREEAPSEIHPWLICRIALESCSTVEEFTDFMDAIPRWAGGENLCVADAHGHMARLSYSTRRLSVTRTKDHFLVSTNHYHEPELSRFGPTNKEYPSTYERYGRLVELLNENYGRVDVETTMKIMSDHERGDKPPEGDHSICRHGEIHQTFTNSIIRPTEGKLWISKGPPCVRNYSTFVI